MLIIKSKNYIVGVSSITEIVGKEKKLEFDKGEEIEVTDEQYETISKLKWCEIKEEK
jgi:hypothetical protein